MRSQPINELERKKMAKTRKETARAARLEARAQIEKLQRERRRVDQKIYTGAIMESKPKKAQLTTVVAECEEMNYGMMQLKGCMDTMEKQIEAIQAWIERMEERMENGENYTDEVEVSPVYSAKEMLKAMTEKVAAVTSASNGRVVTLETYVKGEFVSISVAARDGEGGTNAQAGGGIEGEKGRWTVSSQCSRWVHWRWRGKNGRRWEKEKVGWMGRLAGEK